MVLMESVLSSAIIFMVSRLLNGSVLTVVLLSPWCHSYSLGVSCRSSIFLHDANGTHWECLVNRPSISMVSMVPIGSVLSIVYLSPWWQWDSLRVPCHRLFISMVSLLLNGSILSIVLLSPWCPCYSLRVSCQSSNYLHGVTATHWECLVNRLFFLHCVNGTHWECLVNCLFISMVSRFLIESVLSIVYLSPLCHGYSLGVPSQSSVCLHYVTGTHRLDCQSSIHLHDVMGTHWRCLVNRFIISMMSFVRIGSAFSSVYLTP